MAEIKAQVADMKQYFADTERIKRDKQESDLREHNFMINLKQEN